jgi:hypothetical protein
MIDDILHIFFPRTYTLGNGKVVKEKFNWAPYITIAVIVFSILCAMATKCRYSKINSTIRCLLGFD